MREERGRPGAASVVRPTLLYISRMLKEIFLRVTLNPSAVTLNAVKSLRVNSVKGLMYLKRRDSSPSRSLPLSPGARFFASLRMTEGRRAQNDNQSKEIYDALH